MKWPKPEEKPKMGVGGVMALKATGIVTITEITQKTSGPPVKFPYRRPCPGWYSYSTGRGYL